ncbi:MAG: DUF4142 domain-containing protein [Sediminibacterium sp.]
MKAIRMFLCCGLIISFGCKTSKQNDAVKIADKKNDAKAETGLISQDVADFLVQAADARMMDYKEGVLAVQKGTTKEIKNYGKLMMKDQAALLTKIKKLAADRKISLPADLSGEKKDGYEDLAGKEGKEFDEKFCKMMKIDHERDVKQFTKATELMDDHVRGFAASSLPVIQSHLDKIKAIKVE